VGVPGAERRDPGMVPVPGRGIATEGREWTTGSGRGLGRRRSIGGGSGPACEPCPPIRSKWPSPEKLFEWLLGRTHTIDRSAPGLRSPQGPRSIGKPPRLNETRPNQVFRFASMCVNRMARYRADDSGSPTESVVGNSVSNCLLAHLRRALCEREGQGQWFPPDGYFGFFLVILIVVAGREGTQRPAILWVANVMRF
jgi:hypothetical protein